VDGKPCIQQLIETYEKYGRSAIAVEDVPQDKVSSYGIIKGTPLDESLYAIVDIVEKPEPADAPSNIGAIGRYVFTPEIFDCIEKTTIGVGDEVQLTDGIRMLNDIQKVYAYRFTGRRYDTGDKLGYVKAVVDFAMRNEGMGEQVRTYLKEALAPGSTGI